MKEASILHLYCWQGTKLIWLCRSRLDKKPQLYSYNNLFIYIKNVKLQNTRNMCEECKRHPLFNLELLKRCVK